MYKTVFVSEVTVSQVEIDLHRCENFRSLDQEAKRKVLADASFQLAMSRCRFAGYVKIRTYEENVTGAPGTVPGVRFVCEITAYTTKKLTVESTPCDESEARDEKC